MPRAGHLGWRLSVPSQDAVRGAPGHGVGGRGSTAQDLDLDEGVGRTATSTATTTSTLPSTTTTAAAVPAAPRRKLDACGVARQARRLTLDLLPRGFGKDASQRRSSSGSVTRLIAEGADRCSRGDKRRRFEEASGEVGETVTCLGALDRDRVEVAIGLCGRVGAMLVGLIRRFR